MTQSINRDGWTQAVSISVFLFFSLMLSVPSGYSYGAALLLLISIPVLARQPALSLSAEDKTIAYLLLGVFLVALLTLFVHGNKLNSVDQATRCLLAVPILLALRKSSPRLTYLWAGLIIGSIGAGLLTMYQLHTEPDVRPAGFVTSAIPFGNLALMMGIFCAAGIFWAKTQGANAWRWRIAFLVGAMAGLYCSIQTGSRGGWIALGPVAVLFLIAFLDKRNLYKALAIGAAGLVALTVMFAIPDSTVRIRYDEAVHEVANYAQKRDAETSIGARLEAWRAAAINVPAKPWLGWSYKDYYAEQHRQVAEGKLQPFVVNLVNTHNNYLEVLLFQGIVGLLALMALYVVPFWFFCRRLRAPDLTVRVLAVCGTTLLAGFFTFGMTHVILGRNNGIIFFALSLVILWGCMRHQETKGS